MLSLDLAVATHRPEGILRVARMVLPPADGVRYVVSWQDHRGADIPDELKRPDVEIHRLDTVGQSLNRNNAISHCTADIILHSDDDLTYTRNAFDDIRRTFEENPGVDVATFKSIHGDLSKFPSEETELNKRLPKGYYASCIEIAFRRATAGDCRCCRELGLASERFHGGEDEMFLLSAIKRGLRCRFFPIVICEHRHESTGTKGYVTPQNLMAMGVVIGLSYPLTAVLRLPLKAWRLSRRGRSGFWRALRFTVAGAIAAPGVLRRNRDTLWT